MVVSYGFLKLRHRIVFSRTVFNAFSYNDFSPWYMIEHPFIVQFTIMTTEGGYCLFPKERR